MSFVSLLVDLFICVSIYWCVCVCGVFVYSFICVLLYHLLLSICLWWFDCLSAGAVSWLFGRSAGWSGLVLVGINKVALDKFIMINLVGDVKETKNKGVFPQKASRHEGSWIGQQYALNSPEVGQNWQLTFGLIRISLICGC